MNKQLISKVSTAVVSLATVVSLSGVATFVPAVAHGTTISDLMAQITALQAQLQALQASSSTTATTSAAPASLLSSGNLTLGSKGSAVMDLQKFLNANGAQVAASGAGSPGNETSTFGSLTKAALAKWQAAHNVSPAAGYFGPLTRKAMSAVTTSSTSSTSTTSSSSSTTTTAPAGTGLTVTLAPDQPAPSLAPNGAARIPFTKLNLTASADGAVTVNGLVVERQGLAQDAAVSAVELLDSNGAQMGIKKTLNSNHQATVGGDFTVPAGQTVTVTVAANRGTTSTYAGQTLSLAVVGVNTSANVNATFPMVGATHTINESLTIGSVTMQRGPLDPGTSQTENIGTTGYTFSSVRVTAGSTERVYLTSVRWNQTGSAGSGDLANVKTYVDGTAYDTTVSSDGKYYTSSFPGNGLLIDKGLSKEVYIKGDVVGGSSRTIEFDLAKLTDLGLKGETYGYGITPPQTGSSVQGYGTAAFSSSEDPWYSGAKVTVSSGTMTVSTWTGVNAQNVAINLLNQPLGGWSVDVKGEPISVSNMKFNLNLTQTGANKGGLADVTNLQLVDQTGAVLAGPIDASGTAAYGTVTFTDSVTFPVGVTNLTLKGKLSSNFVTNDTVAASTTPGTGWTTVTGQTTGNTITPSPSSALTSQTMTVKAAALSVSVSSVPIAQTVIAGVSQFEFARYILDTSSSGEDIRLTSLPLAYRDGGSSPSATSLTNCKLYDGSTVVNAANVVNPTAVSSSTTFTFDGTGLTLTKGTTKQLSLKCDVSASATGLYAWGYDSTAGAGTGLTSGQTATVSNPASNGQNMTTATAGSFTVALDSNSPAYAIASPGQTVELARVKFSATNEDISLKQVALQLSGAASNTPVDLVGQKVTLWTTDGLQVGEATFASGDTATSSALSGFVIPKDGSKVMVVKGTLAGISTSGPLTRSGDLLKVDYDGDNMGLNGNYGTGSSSGSTIPSATTATSDTASNGVRIMKAYPTLQQVALSSGESTLTNGDAKTMYKFAVTANNGDVALYKMQFSVSSTTADTGNATTSKFALYAFTDSGFSTPDANFNGTNNPGGLVNAGSCYDGLGSNTAAANLSGNLGAGSVLVNIYPDKTGCNQGTTTLIVPSGATRWFKLVGSIGTLAPSGTSENIQVQLEGDAAYPVNSANLMNQAGNNGTPATGTVDNDTNNSFIWSPVSTTTSNSLSDLDWTNGYGVIGLPSTNMTANTISK
ncbi:MAG: peptidoglycan-binding protein [Patescibacteria group bacterium]|nr:peptidoglycan-binding protein [Patescibacteria group bacterium]